MIETKIHLKGLSSKVTSEDLTEYFIKFGEVRQAYIVTDASGKTKCFGFVQFYNPEVTKVVLQQSHFLYGKKIKCEKFTPREKNSNNLSSSEGKKNFHQKFDTDSNSVSEKSTSQDENTDYKQDNKTTSFKFDFIVQKIQSEKVVDKVISALFDEKEEVESSGSYNPFQSPFGYSYSAKKVHSESVEEQNNCIGYIGQHLSPKKADSVEDRCDFRKSNELHKLLSFFVQEPELECNKKLASCESNSTQSPSLVNSLKEIDEDFPLISKQFKSQFQAQSLRENFNCITNSSILI